MGKGYYKTFYSKLNSMVFFWRKSDVEKKAEKGDKNAILELIKQGKKEKAEKILKKYASEREDLAEVLFELYVQEGKLVQAYPYLKKFDGKIGTAKRARIDVYSRIFFIMIAVLLWKNI
jgi:fused signal recognition particle receptor